LVVVNWYDEADNLIGTGDSIEVCPTEDTTYTAIATYFRCGQTDNVVVEDEFEVIIAPPLPVNDPLDKNVCTTSPININQTDYILAPVDPFEYEVFYFLDEAAALAGATSQALTPAQVASFMTPTCDPVTVYVYIENTFGDACFNVRPFQVTMCNPSGTFSYPPDTDDTPLTYCFNSNSALAPILTNLTPNGTFTVIPAVPGGVLTINPDTGVIDLTGATPGTYEIKYTIGAGPAPDGCAEFTTSTTIVVESCIIANVSNSGPFCVGTATFNLFAAYTEVVGTTTTYQWTDNDGVVISNLQNPIDVPVPGTAGTYTYSLVITQNGTPSQAFTTPLIVHPLPTASFVSTSTTICTNATFTLVFTGTPGATVTFTDGTNDYQVIIDATGNGEFVTPSLSTDTTFTLEGVTGTTVPACSADLDASILISVGLPTATIVGFTPAVICSGTTSGLEIQGTPGSTLTFTIDGVIQPTVTIPTSGTLIIDTGVQTVTTTATYNYALTNIVSNSTPPCSNTITNQSATLTVNALPTVTTFEAFDTSICEGTAAILNFTGTPNATVTYTDGTNSYQVTLNGTGFATATTPLLAADTTFTLVSAEVTNTVPCSNTLSGSVTITIEEEPVITTQPAGDTKCIGDSITFTVAATGAGLTYQWFVGTTEIAGATGASYTIPSLAATDAGVYTVEVSGSCGTPVISDAAVLILTQETLITTQPVALTTLCVGDQLILSAPATGTNITYQWFRGTTALAGQTAATLNIAAVTTADAGTYTVVITNPCQVVTSEEAVVIVNELPVITADPLGVTVCEGQAINLSVTATGTGLTYQWSLGGVAIPGATSATYTVASATLANAGNYTVLVNGICNAPVNSAVATVVVNQVINITAPPQANTVLCAGQTLNLSVTATGTNLTYQWFRGTTALTGQTSNILNIAAVTTAEAGTYTVVITNPCGTVTSTNAVVIVNTLPAITAQPVGTTICEGQAINLSVTATGTGLTYQWSLGGVAIPGATSATYTVASATLANAGNYTVLVNGICNAPVNSAVATVVVNQGTSFPVPPQGSTVCSGQPVTLTAPTNGGTNVTYQWFQGSTPIPGATADTYTITSSTVADSGNYTLVATVASCGTFTSPVAVVVVNQAPAITSQPVDKEICVGQSTTFSVVATGTNLTYQWFKGGVAISGATSSTYTISNATEADSGDFYCIITSASCPALPSDTVTLLVKPLPFATISQGTPSAICEGESTQVIFNGTAGAVVIYTINGGSQETITLNAGVPTILPTGILDETTVYELVSVTYTGPDACSQALTGSATVTVNPLPSVALEDGTICIDPVTLVTTRTYLLDTELNEAEFTFEWFDANGSIPLATNSFYDVNVVGQYGVTITDIITGCQATAYANVGQSSPPTDFDYTVSGFFASNPTIVINATPIGDYEYQLDFGPFQSSNVFDNIEAGTHTITVRDAEACDVLTKEVLIVDYPRYFTPNGDGINDTWNIPTINGISMTKIYIFDRFGKLVKEMTTSGLGWDGTYNGQPLPATDYWFTINYQEAGINKEFRAHFSLKR
jgi:gliding motility-associated-like protein